MNPMGANRAGTKPGGEKPGSTKPARRFRLLESPHLLSLLLLAAVVWSLSGVNWSGPLVHTGGGESARRFLLALFPPELSPEFLLICVRAGWETMSFALAGITIAVLIGFPLGVIASGAMFPPGSPLRTPLTLGVRFILEALRAVHELVWAVLFVAAIGLSPIAAIFALGLPYAGILGRIYSEFLQDVPEEPLTALRSSGASPLQVLIFGQLPMCLPDLVSYTFYRFECAIRSAAILSFVGIQGIGYEIQLSLGDLLFEQVWTLLLTLLALITAIDFWSGRVRRSLITT